MTTGLLATYPAQNPDQEAGIAAQQQLGAAYGGPLITESDQGACFPGAWVQ